MLGWIWKKRYLSKHVEDIKLIVRVDKVNIFAIVQAIIDVKHGWVG